MQGHHGLVWGALSAMLLLSACGRSQPERVDLDMSPQRLAMAAPAFIPPPEAMAIRAAPASQGDGSQMSYSHQLSLQLEAQRLKSAYQEIVEACKAAGPAKCVVLRSGFKQDQAQEANVDMKVERTFLSGLQQKARALGKVTEDRTEAEDLGAVIVDSQRRLAIKKSFRDSLQALMAKPQANVEALQKIVEKLNEVQAEIEGEERGLKELKDRVQMDDFHLKLFSKEGIVERPDALAQAASDFVPNLQRALGDMVVLLARFLPWALLTLLLYTLVRWLRIRWLKHQRARKAGSS
ncbi:DUF4349 domain-containing protein [Pelomonas sp. V22]|uniref:DUF4349 domain-containing protein n=1 Tax=Pelomonas sp. V22 TaxID=2822139 RepID=UPI0024A7FABD|nr:DUF4349 domain-containing protein [Pelomonas sp. V22]MDI4631873.1 DUF4349 domain-containing protein [Pelomonas sp. V22]